MKIQCYILIILFSLSVLMQGCKYKNTTTQENAPKHVYSDNRQIIKHPEYDSGSRKPILKAFSEQDLKVEGISLNMELGLVLKTFGKPKTTSKEYDDSIGGYTKTLVYPFGKLSFEQQEGTYFLYNILIQSPTVTGPRNTKIGEDANSITLKFPNTKQPKKGNSQILYEDFSGEGGKGIVTFDVKGNVSEIDYYYGTSGAFGTYSLIYRFELGKVKEIELDLQNV